MLILLSLSVAWAHSECTGTNHFRLPTSDGAEIGLHRHSASGPPVLVVHGIRPITDADLNDERSIATTLNAHDLDTWFLDLRGHGCAERKQDGERQDVLVFDVYGTIDVHTAIQFIQRKPAPLKLPTSDIQWGNVATAYLTEHGDDSISRSQWWAALQTSMI